MSPRILVADDHPMIRQALRRLLEQNGWDVVGEAWDGDEADRLAYELCADVVILGFTRPLSSCLSVIAKILQRVRGTSVILIAFEDYLVAQAFQAGIKGYVLKTRVVEELPRAVRAVARGNVYLSPEVPVAIADACRTASRPVPSGT